MICVEQGIDERELLRQKELLQVPYEPIESLSSGHTRVGFSKMSIHESFLVVMLSIFFSPIDLLLFA